MRKDKSELRVVWVFGSPRNDTIAFVVAGSAILAFVVWAIWVS